MNQCPFWSTTKEKIECFKDCVFYMEEERTQEVCPFKLYENKHSFRIKELLEYDLDPDFNESYDNILW